MAYTDTTKIAQRLERALTANETALLSGVLIPMVKTLIDSATNRTFEESESVKRTYYGFRIFEPSLEEEGYRYNAKYRDLELGEDFQNITKVEEFDSLGQSQCVIDLNTIELQPFNTAYKSRLHLPFAVWWGYKYEVTGTLGYTKSAPSDITYAATEILVGVLRDKGYERETIEGYTYILSKTIEDNPIVAGILAGYNKILV